MDSIARYPPGALTARFGRGQASTHTVAYRAVEALLRQQAPPPPEVGLPPRAQQPRRDTAAGAGQAPAERSSPLFAPFELRPGVLQFAVRRHCRRNEGEEALPG